jgi:ABC-type bacteriocin/lantibiotic exporter with double-glycine peptidase domain
LGSKGVKISGGQKQRIALARVFYHQRDIIFMDESTSSLDNETEKEILDEIEKFKGKKTFVIISHRLPILQNCDLIYQLDHYGKIMITNYKKMTPYSEDLK